MATRSVRFSIYRYNPDQDAKPYMQDLTVELQETDKMLLDALMRIKSDFDDSLSYRRSCREGVCGSDAMNINGKNGLACITNLRELKEPIVLRPLPGLKSARSSMVSMSASSAPVAPRAAPHFGGIQISLLAQQVYCRPIGSSPIAETRQPRNGSII